MASALQGWRERPLIFATDGRTPRRRPVSAFAARPSAGRLPIRAAAAFRRRSCTRDANGGSWLPPQRRRTALRTSAGRVWGAAWTSLPSPATGEWSRRCSSMHRVLVLSCTSSWLDAREPRNVAGSDTRCRRIRLPWSVEDIPLAETTRERKR